MISKIHVSTQLEEQIVCDCCTQLDLFRQNMAARIYSVLKDLYDHSLNRYKPIAHQINYDELMGIVGMQDEYKIDFANFIGERGIKDTLDYLAAQDGLEIVKGKEWYDFHDFVCVDNPNIHKQVALHSRTTLYLRPIKK